MVLAQGAGSALTPLFQLPLHDLWNSTVGFVAVFVSLVFVVGLVGRSLAVGAVGAFTMFVHFGVLVDSTLLTQVMYISLGFTTLALGFKLWNVEGPGQGA